jgi:hypothetical protein
MFHTRLIYGNAYHDHMPGTVKTSPTQHGYGYILNTDTGRLVRKFLELMDTAQMWFMMLQKVSNALILPWPESLGLGSDMPPPPPSFLTKYRNIFYSFQINEIVFHSKTQTQKKPISCIFSNLHVKSGNFGSKER